MLVKYLLAKLEIFLGLVMLVVSLLGSLVSRQFMLEFGLGFEAIIWLTPSHSFFAFVLCC